MLFLLQNISFQNCSKSIKQSSYLIIDKESKCFGCQPILPSRTSQDFSKNKNTTLLFTNGRQFFKPLITKEFFLDLNNDKEEHICLIITNHISIDKYRLRFFPKESIACLYNNYSIETRRHILFECLRFNKCWNPKRKSLINILMFLKFNPKAFYFLNNIIAQYHFASSLNFLFLYFTFSFFFFLM